MEHVVEQITSVKSTVFLDQFFGEVEHDAYDATAGDKSRERVQQQGCATEFLNIEAHLCHEFRVFKDGGRLNCSAFDGFGDEQSLGFDDTCENFSAEVFVHDAFVQRVLVDDFESGVAGDDKVAVVDLEGAEFVSDDFW